MWYLALLAVGIAAVSAWFFFNKALPPAVPDEKKDPEPDVAKEEAKAAIIAVVEQVKAIAAEKSEPAVVTPPAPPAPAPKPKRKAPAAPASKKAAAPKRTKKL
jgi:hypothetical protein